MQELSARELADWLQNDERAKPLLLDVREPSEFERCAIPQSKLMPMGSVTTRFKELDPESEIVCICHHGARSMQVARYLAAARVYKTVQSVRRCPCMGTAG